MSVAIKEGSELTALGDLTVEFRAASHSYWLIKDKKRVRVQSPTGALNVLEKPALLRWYAREAAMGIHELWQDKAEFSLYPDGRNVLQVLKDHNRGPEVKRDAGADRGTAIHKVLQDYCESGVVPSLSDFEPEVRGYCQGLAKWLVEAAPEPVLTEQVVASWEHKLAGRFDLLAKVDGELALIDLKTGARGRVYPEHHLQTAAYVHLLGECLPKYWQPEGLIVAVGRDGDVEAKSCAASWEQFKAVLDCSRVMKELKAA